MRQGEHDRVVAGEHLGRGVLEQPVGQRGQVRVDAAERLPGVRRGGEGTDLEVGVLEEQAHDLTAGVPARPGDCDASHVHDYTELRTLCTRTRHLPALTADPTSTSPQVPVEVGIGK